ncbi:hypothetical protein DFJ58DRAFT_202125 [Suillus subalutaceus]|uniref:uncharacterized protein n=1 Tax=Suillus subalutaceus TaxID=48586 RepID=UPI001B87FCB3|nr:uncharacterized protein DFJ58DRAFT_202125 [Suillus subalutaceus]KAG1835403.1 hypothetical protein DFJ58DRAFT_202125 [Suillus subalutaceus]
MITFVRLCRVSLYVDIYCLLTRDSDRDQLVTLTNRTPHRSVRIVGITPDHGLLRTVPMGCGEFIDLQPDGNSLDMMKGLISTKG